MILYIYIYNLVKISDSFFLHVDFNLAFIIIILIFDMLFILKTFILISYVR